MPQMLTGPRSRTTTIYCAAIIFAAGLITTSCATNARAQQYAAYGYLTPGPTSEPAYIGAYNSQSDCAQAADNWASRQVVGNPVFTECLPVDQD